MHNFRMDKEKCVSCGLCAADCLFSVLKMKDGHPDFANPEHCIGCLHCYAICPAGAISMDEYDPAKALPQGKIPEPERVEAFIRQRRSTRSFKEENIDPAVLQNMLETAWSAPSGVNQHRLLISAINDRKKMDAFRELVYDGLREMKRKGQFADEHLQAYLGSNPDAWLQNDVIFRHAPHLVVASYAPDAATGIPDCLIYLSYLEFLACSKGFGTLWCGLGLGVLNHLPEATRHLGIPADYKPGYVMLLGISSVHYARGIMRHDARIRLV